MELQKWEGTLRGAVCPRRRTEGVEPDTVKAVSPVLNGGCEETYSNATRLAPTQPRFRQQLTPGVRGAADKAAYLMG
jgi:hypothetical protein